jgi:hypothetical protein
LKLSEPAAHEQGPDVLRQLREALGLLPASLAAQVVSCDLARIDAALAQLERWWGLLSEQAGPSDAQLERIAESRFFHVTRDEGALPRFALEAELLAELMPQAEVSPLRARISDLEQRSAQAIAQLLGQASDRRWQALLSNSSA